MFWFNSKNILLLCSTPLFIQTIKNTVNSGQEKDVGSRRERAVSINQSRSVYFPPSISRKSGASA
jgi:hypothetical protein